METTDALSVIKALGFILLGGLAGGKLAQLCHVPRVTGYLLVGVVMGPSLAALTDLPELIPPAALKDLKILSDLALGLILLHIGGYCRTEHLRRWKKGLLWLAGAEIGLTFLLVTLTTALINLGLLRMALPGLTLGQTSLAFGLVLGAIAIATAPGATLMVIREYDADGAVTHTTLTLVGLNNVASILVFIGVGHWVLDPAKNVGMILWLIGGPLLLGTIVGLGVSYAAERIEIADEHKLLLIGMLFATSGLARWLGISPMLTALVFGVVTANSSPRWHRLTDALNQIDNPLYVAFFVLAGVNLHLETLGHLGLLGLGYIAARTAGKTIGARIGARLGGFSRLHGHYTGFTLLAQAGVAIGLSATLAQQWPEGGRLVESVVLGAVVIFEIAGPLAIRHGLVRAGEVPILSLLRKRSATGAVEGLQRMAQHLRTSLGLHTGRNRLNPAEWTVRHVMRLNVETILDSTPFSALLHTIAHSRYDRFPVVNADNDFIGMINYAEIRNLLFEPSLANLVVASDLASEPQVVLAPEQSLREALAVLNHHPDISYFPVVSAGDPDRLLGILSQNDLIAAFRRQPGD